MIAVLSDIHGNLPALQAVLDRSDSLGCERIISLGDVVGYYAQPGECIDLLKSRNAINIMGNHDSYIVNDMDCPRSRMVTEITNYQRSIVTAGQKYWLSGSLPTLIEERNFFTHGGWKDPQDQYLYRVSGADIPPGARNLFSGHTHVQIIADFGDKTYCNPGSVGQPRDGDNRSAFATLDGYDIRLHRVEYDIDRTAAAMKQAGFPDRYWENLFIGAQIGGRIDKVTIRPE